MTRQPAAPPVGPLPECPVCHHRNVHEPTFGGCLEELVDDPRRILGKPLFCCCKAREVTRV